MRYILYLGIISIIGISCSKEGDQIILDEPIEETFFHIPELDKLTKLTSYSIRTETGHGINALSTDGQDIYALHYTGTNKILKFNFKSARWESLVNPGLNSAINKISGEFNSPGGFSIAGDTLWVSNAYGSSYGAILKSTGEIIYEHKFTLRSQSASQSYSGMVFDYPYAYLAYHSFFYDDKNNDLQTLLKFDIRSKELVSETPLSIDNKQKDGVHGLALSDDIMWHVRNDRLSQISSFNGDIMQTFALDGINRPSGISFLDSTLYIVSFDGDLFRLPMR